MGFLPIFKMYFPDELLYSWLWRLAKMNHLSMSNFLESYCSVSKAKYLKPDVQNEWVSLHGFLYRNVSSIDTYLDTSTFCFELFGMSQERQFKKLQAVFWPADKLNRSWYPFFTTLKICPQCIAEDEVPYIRKSHQLSGVCTCHKHGCHLLEYNGKPGNEMNFNLEDYQECQSEIDIEILRAYTSYAVKLLEAKIWTNLESVRSLLLACIERSGYNRKNRQKWIDEFKKWQYAALFKGDINLFFQKNRLPQIMSSILPVIMYLYPDPNDFISAIPYEEPLTKLYECQVCGKEYISMPFYQNNGWGCPYCNKKKSIPVRLEDIFSSMHQGEYVLESEFKNLSDNVIIRHKTCGERLRVTAGDYLYGKRICPCADHKREIQIKTKIESHKGFKLLKYESDTSIVHILHEKCKKTFESNYFYFAQKPRCPFCYPVAKLIDKYKIRIAELVGNSYSLVRINAKTKKVVIRHNKCGCEQIYDIYRFEKGQRCKKCMELIDWRVVQDLLDVFSEHRYRIMKCKGNWCDILDQENGNTWKMLTIHIMQEIQRPTPSEIFSFLPANQIDLSKVAFSRWDRNYMLLCEYKEKFGNMDFSKKAKYKGINLRNWVSMQRVQYKNHKLSEEKIKKLEKIGFDFEVSENQWMRNYEAYKQYIETLNEKNVIEYDAVEVNRLKTWINSQKAQDKKLKLSSKRKKMLEDIGVDFTYKW